MREGMGRISNRRYRARQMRQRSVVPGAPIANDRIDPCCIIKMIKDFDFETLTEHTSVAFQQALQKRNREMKRVRNNEVTIFMRISRQFYKFI